MRQSLRRKLIGFSVCPLGTAGLLAAGAFAAGGPKPGQACTATKAAAYRRAHLVCVHGHLKKLPPAPKPAPTPGTTTTTTTTTTQPPVPMPVSGHYAGTTQQGYNLAFDVQPDLKNLTNIVGGPVDETCNPTRAFQFFGFETGGFDYPISSATGTFTLNGGTKSNSGGVDSSTKIKVVATFDGTAAHGTYEVTSTFTDQGAGYTCQAAVTWTATHS